MDTTRPTTVNSTNPVMGHCSPCYPRRRPPDSVPNMRQNPEGRSRAKVSSKDCRRKYHTYDFRANILSQPKRGEFPNAQLPPRVGPKEFGEAASRFPATGTTCLRLVRMRRLLLQVGPGGRLGPDAPLRWQWPSCRPFSGGVTQVGQQCSLWPRVQSRAPGHPSPYSCRFEWPTMAK